MYVSRVKLRLLLLVTIVFALPAIPSASFAEVEGGEDVVRQALFLSGGAVYVPEGTGHADVEEGRWVGTVGIGYKYKLREPWSLAVVVEVELDEYLVYESGLVREYPVILAGLAHIETAPRLSLYTGFGAEIETHETLALFRAGVNYEIQIKELWAIAPTFYFDLTKEYAKFAIAVEFGRWL